MKRVILLMIIISGFFLSGCAPQYHDKPLDINTGKGVLVDIKQRAILVHDERKTDKMLSVCAEPSPDALSAYAIDIYKKDKENAAGLSFSETAAYIGLRTQSIQLLRDALYRLCEGFLSGVLDHATYGILMHRYQKYMIAALAIEQLTNAVKVPPPSIVIKSSPSKSVENVSISYHQNKEGVERVAEVVDSIVEKALKSDRDLKEMCQIHLVRAASTQSTQLIAVKSNPSSPTTIQSALFRFCTEELLKEESVAEGEEDIQN